MRQGARIGFGWSVFLAVAMFLSNQQYAHAYLDGASISFFVQIIIAGIAGSAFGIRVFWDKISDFFRKYVLRTDDTTDRNE